MAAKKKPLLDVAQGFGVKHQELHQKFQAAVTASARVKTAAAATAAGIRVISVPAGTPVTLRIIGSGVSSQAILNHVLLPQQDLYSLHLQSGPNNLAWLVTPVIAPWAFQVLLTVAALPPQELDKGAGQAVGDPVVNQVMLNVT